LSLDRLSAEDAAILALESPTVAGHTCKLVLLGEGHPVTVTALRDRVASRLDAAPRLRRRIAPTPLGLAPPAWVDDTDFDLARHVRRVPPARRARGEAELKALVARTMEERLDRDHPLWSLDVVEELAGGGSALIWKLHHALADGAETMRLADAILWDEGPAPGATSAWTPEPAPGTAGLLAAGLRHRGGAVTGELGGLARGLVSPAAWRGGAREARRLPGAVARDLLPDRFDSPLDAAATGRRAIAFGTGQLELLKRIEHAQPQRTTVNDVLLALVAGGLRRWLTHHGGAATELRVKVPVSLHDRHAHPDALANRDSFLCVALPLAEPDPAARLAAIAAQTRERKREHDAETLDALFRDLRHAPRPVARLATRLTSGPRTFALEVSNVPGPSAPRHILNAPVTALRSLAEIGERHALRVSAISLAGTLHLGLNADAAAVEDVEVLAAGMEAELRDLAAA
jgi:diacylglycerol O-acyltransferase / wax synthase